MLPNFIVIGAGKAGTTSLWLYLDAHPQVFMSRQKELDFFTTEHNWNRGLEWYSSNFDGSEGYAAVGEASGNYTNWPTFAGVPERMASVVPDARLVYVLRHPIERIVSAYRYARVAEGEHRSMIDAVRANPTYVNASSYSSQIEQYLEHFAREQLLLITSEDLLRERTSTMREVFTYLGVDPTAAAKALNTEYNRTDEKVNTPRMALRWAQRVPGYHTVAANAPAGIKRLVTRVAKVPIVTDEESRMSDDLRRDLEDALREDVRRLRVHIGPDFHCWGLA